MIRATSSRRSASSPAAATALPPIERGQLGEAAHLSDPEDLALLAMLVDGTPASDAAETLRLDRRRVGRRIERLLGRLRQSREPALVLDSAPCLSSRW